jgi:hypothetical protein
MGTGPSIVLKRKAVRPFLPTTARYMDGSTEIMTFSGFDHGYTVKGSDDRIYHSNDLTPWLDPEHDDQEDLWLTAFTSLQCLNDAVQGNASATAPTVASFENVLTQIPKMGAAGVLINPEVLQGSDTPARTYALPWSHCWWMWQPTSS